MQVHCRICGKPLRDPISVARGMGPTCAGIPSTGKTYHAKKQQTGGKGFSSNSAAQVTPNLFSYVEEPIHHVPDVLRKFPTDLINLVLSTPPADSIASGVKLYAQRGKKTGHGDAYKLIKQIRRMCIDFRLRFWPGLSMNLQPIPCIPHGENEWKIGENGRVVSKDELVAYLSRYGIISGEQAGIQASE